MEIYLDGDEREESNAGRTDSCRAALWFFGPLTEVSSPSYTRANALFAVPPPSRPSWGKKGSRLRPDSKWNKSTRDRGERRKSSSSRDDAPGGLIMKRSQKIILWLGLITYGLVLFAVLTFYRLPADKILSKAIDAATQGKVFVSAEKMSSFWKGHRLENVTWSVQSGSALVSDRMESLTLSPRFLGLFQGYLPIEMEGILARGTFQFTTGISMIRGLSRGYANLTVFGIHLADLAAVNQTLQREIKGKLTGRAEFQGLLNEPSKLNGQATILIEDGALDTRMGAFGFGSIPFEKLSLPLTVRNGVASLKGGQLVGPVFTGEIEGQIRLLQNLQVSPLQITATMRPGSSHAGEKGGSLPDKPFVIQLEGTVGKPTFTMAGGR
jgi:type II secretion system protein N